MAAFLAVLLLLPVSSRAAEAVFISREGRYEVGGVKSMLDMRFRDVSRQIYDYSCGSASLATLLNYHYGMKTDEAQLIKAMLEAGDKEKIKKEGFSLLDMKNYLKSVGLNADGYRESLDSLAKAGVPAIILINNKGYLHFVVVKGVRGNKVLVGDPAAGLKIVTRSELEAMWNGILFVINNKRDVAKRTFNNQKEWAGLEGFDKGFAVNNTGSHVFNVSIAYTPFYY